MSRQGHAVYLRYDIIPAGVKPTRTLVHSDGAPGLKIAEFISFDSHTLNDMANFPPPQQHTFTLGVGLGVFYILLLSLPQLLFLVLSWCAWFQGMVQLLALVILTQLSGARRNLFATHLPGNFMFVNLGNRRRTEVDDRPRESTWNLECNFHRSHFAHWLAH